MKKILLSFLLLPFLASCDHVNETERFIEVENRPFERKVLLEEFTGQRCTNCPTAHDLIEKLEEQYGDNMVVVSIHAGTFGIPAENEGLMQPEGEEYASSFGVTLFPNGIVDRTGSAQTMDAWAGLIRQKGIIPTNLDINVAAELSADRKTINIQTGLFAERAAVGNLQLWVVEDGIVGMQIDGRNILMDYVHNNVFRGAVNGTWGEPVTIETNETLDFTHSIPVYEDGKYAINNWNPDNLSIVAFFYNDEGVVAVDKVKVE